MRKILPILMILTLLPIVFAGHSESPFTNRQSVLDVPTTYISDKQVTATESYPYTGPRAVLPSSLQIAFCDPESGQVTDSPSYVGMFSEDYYDDVKYDTQRVVDLTKPRNASRNITGGYWGASPNAQPTAWQRLCVRREYGDYYDPRTIPFGYHQRIINKDTDYRPEVTIDAPPPQRLLEGDARVRSLSLPDYVDPTEVPWYEPPADPRARAYLFTEVEPNRRVDNQGAYRFIPGNYEDRSYYYLDEHTYATSADRAQRVLRTPELMAQRVLAPGGYGRAQRLLNDQYGEKYGYTITAPSLIELYDIQEPGIGSIHDNRLYAYVRYAGRLPSSYLQYDVDPRIVNDEDLAEEYRDAYYDLLEVEAPTEESGIISPEGSAYRRYSRTSSLAYYQQKLAFLNSRQQFLTRRASRTPVEYLVSTERESENAQRLLQYQKNPPAQRILGEEPSTAQRTIG